MARVTVTHRINDRVLTGIPRSSGMRVDMTRRAVRVQSAARDRLGFDPRRIDTGRLRASISIAIELGRVGWVAIIFTNVEYAIFVHEGTRFMRANPFLRDALKRTQGGSRA